MSILYLVVDGNENNKEISTITKDSLSSVFKKGDNIIFKNVDERELFYLLKPEKQFDFVCLLPNDSEINNKYVEILNDYYVKRDEKVIYLPLVVLTNKIKAVLNGCLWNSNLTEEVGVLNYELARKQIDTTLFGSFIPFDLFFDKENYDDDLKYYQHFHFLNKVTAAEGNLVFGVPKTLLYTPLDLSFSDVTTDEKIKYFKQAAKISS